MYICLCLHARVALSIYASLCVRGCQSMSICVKSVCVRTCVCQSLSVSVSVWNCARYSQGRPEDGLNEKCHFSSSCSNELCLHAAYWANRGKRRNFLRAVCLNCFVLVNNFQNEVGCLLLACLLACLLNFPAACQCISETDLLRQFYVLTHGDRSCRPNFPSHPVTVY